MFALPDLMWIITAWITGLSQGSPKVELSVVPVIACHDLTPVAYSAVVPNFKLVEARFRVTALCRGNSSHIGAVYFKIESPKKRILIADYCPRSTLEPTSGSRLVVETTSVEQSNQQISAHYMFRGTHGAGNASSSTSTTKQSKVESYSEFPHIETLVESGRINADFGVEFKLRRTPRHMVTGEKTFTLLLRVPSTWEGDWVYCDIGVYDKYEGGLGSKEYGKLYRPIALHLSTSVKAREAAEALSLSYHRLNEGNASERLQEQVKAMNALSDFSAQKTKEK